MKLEDIQKDLKNILSPKRFHHSEGVAAMGKHLAEKYGADPEKRTWPAGFMTAPRNSLFLKCRTL